MQQTALKKIRVILSSIFFALCVLLFADYNRLQQVTSAKLIALWPQFGPSLLGWVHTFTWAAAGYLFVIALTFLFGRVYCSTICPLGTLQDMVIHIATRLRKAKVKFKYQLPHDRIRYGVLALTIGVWASGSALLWQWLDPFSNFGRIITDLVRPLYIVVHNAVGGWMESMGWYGPLPILWKAPPMSTLIFPVIFLVGLIIASVFKGRLFCNTLCPVGAILGLVARAAVFKIRIPKDACIVCAQCSMHCKAGCIRLKTREVDFSRCVACFNCITACGKGHGIGYARALPISPALPPNPPHEHISRIRRAVLQNGALAFLGWLTVPRPSNALLPTKLPVVPPGAGSLAKFNDRCTACHLCVSACPYGVLQPAVLEYGLSGLLQPRMDYAVGYCSYDCNQCTHVCPTGALLPLPLLVKQTTALGTAYFSRNHCLRYTDGIPCSRCESHCPTEAVQIVAPENGGMAFPRVRKSLCIGCGNCENVCPARPERAITVFGAPKQYTVLRVSPLLDRAP